MSDSSSSGQLEEPKKPAKPVRSRLKEVGNKAEALRSFVKNSDSVKKMASCSKQITNVLSAATSKFKRKSGQVLEDIEKDKAVMKILSVGNTRIAKIYLVTWNVHGKPPPEDFSDLLSLRFPPLADIYAIGLQEIGSHDWEGAISDALKDNDYVKVKARRLQGIITLVFVKRLLLPFVTSFESEVTKTGMGGYWGNKGAASVRMDFMGMNLIVVNSHLAAHMDEVVDRIVNIDMILDTQRFRDRDTDNVMDHDYIFWMGDLNFRIENMSYNRAMDLIRERDYTTLLANDQLGIVMEEGLVFEDFREGEIHFPPTYKFDPGTDNYDTSVKQRIPSYTDRILYHFHDTSYGKMNLHAQIKSYRCHPNYRSSDHKPVTALIDFNVLASGVSSPVVFQINREPWQKDVDREVHYHVSLEFEMSPWDWIGFYKADFQCFDNYATYVRPSMKPILNCPSKSRQCYVIQVSSFVLSGLEDGFYVLCYLTKKNSLCGISQTFLLGSAAGLATTSRRSTAL